jgi:hypothetical protein
VPAGQEGVRDPRQDLVGLDAEQLLHVVHIEVVDLQADKKTGR